MTPQVTKPLNSLNVAKYTSVPQIIHVSRNDPQIRALQLPQISPSPQKCPTNSQDLQTPPKYCQIAFNPQISRPSDSLLPVSILQPLNIAKSQEMPQCHQASLNCPKYYPFPFNPPKITMLPSSLTLLLILIRLPEIEPNSQITTDMDSFSPLGPTPMNFSHVPSSGTCPLPDPAGLAPLPEADQGPCPTHQNSPSSFFTSKASHHSAGSASQRGQLGRPRCKGWAGATEPPTHRRSIPPVTPGPRPLHSAPWAPQLQQMHVGEAQ